MDDYQGFLERKRILFASSGLSEIPEPNPLLFPFQKDIVKWSLRKGRAAIFADCGLGKSFMQIEWARSIPGRVLILAPLAVATQTVREASKLGVTMYYLRDSENRPLIATNYDILDHFDPDMFDGVVLDESSILKNFSGKIRNELIDSFRNTRFKLACTATPAPNDYMELGNHAEFVGAMTRTEMLSTFFVHDGGDTSKWRLKKHAAQDFWKWVCSWAVMMRKPSDLGYSDDGFILPPLTVHQNQVESDWSSGAYLFPVQAKTLQERREARRESIDDRAREVAAIVTRKHPEQFLIWCNLNDESKLATELIPGAVEITGPDSREVKESRLLRFISGEIRTLVTKPGIAGMGLNLQNCHNVIFFGLSDSYESWYQAVRRCWRFGQKEPVDCYIVTASSEGAVVENIRRKETEAAKMAEEMVSNMHEINEAEIRSTERQEEEYSTDATNGENWNLVKGDCAEVLKPWPSDSIHYSIFSPPFASLYTYSASERDMGNCRSHAEFYDHFKFLTTELYRVLMPGRLLSFHCMNLPTSKERDGFIGISDFRGDLIRMFQESGFIYHSEVVIWKDPVTAMQRTKALGLLHKQLKKDSCMSRQGIPDYLVTVRKPGENPERVEHTNDSFPVSLWQRYASPVWMDIDPSDTLSRKEARENEDERHICPLQLQVIQRALEIWTNPDDLVLDPFAGIGSTGYQALQMGRKFLGVELKGSYYEQAVRNLRSAEIQQQGLFAEVAESV